RIARFRDEQPAIHVPLSRPAGLHELAEGKIDALIECGLDRHPGYRCDRLADGGGDPPAAEFLICPAGTADCPEIVALRRFLLAPAYGRAPAIASPRERAASRRA